MEARQRVKLSLTNRSSGLISPSRIRPAQRKARKKRQVTKDRRRIRQTHHILTVLTRHDRVSHKPSGGWSTWWS